MASNFNSKYEMHGRECKAGWAEPILVAKSSLPNRKDQGNKTLANEFLDDKAVLEQKMEVIATLIKKSKCVIVYSGAGLSRASGIPDYATKAENSIVNFPKIKSSLDALPTYSHFILTRMYQAGYLQYWVQQNHDGLPQKAGYPQEKINEIHGAWFDPSNPVVQFSGSLRGDLFNEMIEYEKKADFCLCLGTSLSGMNADRMATTPAKKYLLGGGRKSQGTAIINIQKTHLDEDSSVRVWAKLDDAFEILAKKLGIDSSLPSSPLTLPSFGDQMIFSVPYDNTGKYDPTVRMTLNLEIGEKIKITSPGSSNQNCVGFVYKRSKADLNWSVALLEDNHRYNYAFGWWMVDAALRGAIPYLPFTNLSPVIVEYTEPLPLPSSDSLTNNKNDDLMDVEILSNNNNNNQHQKPNSNSSKIVLVGNEHTLENDDHNPHAWTCFVRVKDADKKNPAELSNTLIEKVTFKLHPTFSPSSVTVKQYPFSVTRYGWGTFTIHISIHWKDGSESALKHKLQFSDPLAQTEYSF